MDANADKLDNSYTRVGNEFKLLGRLDVGDTITVHYYRRLPMLDAIYNVNVTNFNAQTNLREFMRPTTTGETGTTLYFSSDADRLIAVGNSTGARTIMASSTTTNFSGTFIGLESAHWLRDQNERILIFGTLMEVFSYLDEPEAYAKYQDRFYNEIEDLNSQERRRDAAGGNVQLQYSGGGLL